MKTSYWIIIAVIAFAAIGAILFNRQKKAKQAVAGASSSDNSSLSSVDTDADIVTAEPIVNTGNTMVSLSGKNNAPINTANDGAVQLNAGGGPLPPIVNTALGGLSIPMMGSTSPSLKMG